MYEFTDPSEIKLLILYIIRNFREPITNGQITDIFMTHEFVNYFSMQQYLDELVQYKLVDVDLQDGVRMYILTAHGEEAYNSYIRTIPLTVREKVMLTVRAYKKKLKNSADITASYHQINELEYAIDCAIKENGFPLLELHMSVGSQETAKEACRRFKEKPQSAYAALLGTLIDTEK